MRLTEPTTAITDYVLSVELSIFAVLLYARSLNQQSILLWCASFAFLALSAFTGGTYHGFKESLVDRVLNWLWRSTAFAIILSITLMVAAGVISSSSGILRIGLLLLCPVVFVCALIVVTRKQNQKLKFRRSVTALLTLLIFLFVLLCYYTVVPGPPVAKWMIAGAILCIGAAILEQKGFRLHRHFNENDLAHLVLMLAIFFLYRGGLLLRDH